MRVKAGKSIFLLGFWTFLLLFLKESFPKAAYAGSCTASPACAEVLAYEAGSALAPAVAAPTAAGSAATVNVTTATGVTTTEAAAGVAVVGDMRLSGLAAYYIWKQDDNERAQKKAKEKYCTANPLEVNLCGARPGHYRAMVRDNSWTGPFDLGQSGCSHHFDFFSPYGYDIWQPFPGNSFVRCGYTADTLRSINIKNADGTFQREQIANSYGGYISITALQKDPTPWQDWPQAKRDAAVASLNNSDWLEAYAAMKLGGFLKRGSDSIQTGTIIEIPTTNGSLPKKLTGSYTPNESPSPGSLTLTPAQQKTLLERKNYEQYVRLYTPQQDDETGCIAAHLPIHLGSGQDEPGALYATQVSGSPVDYFVLSNSGHGIAYDGLTPNTRNVWEAKNGYYSFFFGYLPDVTDIHRAERLVEWDIDKNEGLIIASECGYNLTWAFSDWDVAKLAEERWTVFPPKPRIIDQVYLGN